MTNKPQMPKRATRVAQCLTLSAMLCMPLAAHAERDLLIEGARECTQYFPVEEGKNGIPTHLLAAIATTESGRWHEGLGMNVPWPWTINVDGKGYFFTSKAEAIAQTQNFLAKGKQSIDVGCMQVNLKHHAKAFANLNEAFDPKTNVAYAAKFLHDNYADLGDWIKATAAYHSRTPVYGARYLTDIERSWNRIVAKVAAARATKNGTGDATTVALAGGPAVAQVSTTASSRTVYAAPVKVMSTPHKSRVIQVRDSVHNSGQVVVVRATPSTPVVQPVTIAEATPSTLAPVATVAATTAPAGDSVRRVSLDTPPSTTIANTPNPKFVFAN